MANLGTVTWLPGLVLTPFLRLISPEGLEPASNARETRWVVATFLFVYSLAVFWLNLVTKNVPDPYLDEIFHIPQAQTYCNGRYDYWDPKLTTPPGLYIFVTVFTKLRWATWGVLDLRLFNTVVLPITMLYALSCRHLINFPLPQLKSISADTMHTALNVALFPPLFFFSGLFYTDLLSTCIVLATYRLFLQRRGAGLWVVYPVGMLALTMRQTNIFWVAVFLGGLEAVRTVKSSKFENTRKQVMPRGWKDRIVSELGRWGRGEIHDVLLEDAGVNDLVLCAISIAVAILHQPFQILVRLWPYIALLVSFGGFVYWNEGVVLGDKSNHVATIHLPQVLYLFVFAAFFSIPLIIPPILIFLRSLLSLLQLPLFPRLLWKYILATTYCVGALGVTLLVIRYNTVIHPFTLADNRHYVFYVFRYTILRHQVIRYLLAPVYLACGWAVYLTLCSPSLSSQTPRAESKNTEKKKAQSRGNDKLDLPKKRVGRRKDDGPTTSFILIFLFTTALSLITAPLVEPRYFIIPWVIWRLHVPSLVPSLSSASTPQNEQKGKGTVSELSTMIIDKISWAYQGHDYRLCFETFWFLGINIITGYIFLYCGFSWPQEPGKVQRFMW